MYVYILIDLETTGLDTRKDRVISLAAKVLNKDLQDFPVFVESHDLRVSPNTFQCFVHPFMQNHAVNINNLQDSFLRRCFPFDFYIKAFWDWIRDVSGTNDQIVFIGHNFDYFDETMLLAELSRTNTFSYIPQQKQFFKIDTMKLFRYIFPITTKSIPYGLPVTIDAPESYKQVDVYSFLFNKQPSNQHDALGDVLALEEILNTDVFKSILPLATPEFSRIQFKNN